jgi:hypothetical protein
MNKAIENMRQTLSEEEFTKLESDVQANLAKFLKEVTGIEGARCRYISSRGERPRPYNHFAIS